MQTAIFLEKQSLGELRVVYINIKIFPLKWRGQLESIEMSTSWKMTNTTKILSTKKSSILMVSYSVYFLSESK